MFDYVLHRIVGPLLIALTFTSNAGASNEVNVYSFRQPYLIKPMFEEFTKQTDIKVNTVFAKSGLVERLINEGRNSPADLLLTVDVGRMSDAVSSGVTQPVNSKVLLSNIPASFRGPNNHWFALSNRARIIVTSKDRVSRTSISSYEDLANPEFIGKICTRSGKHEYMVALTASIIAHSGEEATRIWLEGLKRNLARKPQGNDRAQVKAISEGQCDIALVNSYYMGAMLENPDQVAWAESVNIVFPNSSTRGTHMNSSGIILTKAASNKDNAIKLMEFLSGEFAQKMYAEINHEYPVKEGVEWSELIESWGTFNHDTLALSEIAKYRTTASKLADLVGYDN